MINGLNFVIARVADVAAARQFYTETLGFEIEDELPGFVQFRAPSGASYAIGVDGQKGDTELWWVVDDAEATLADLVARGVEVAKPLADRPFGRTFAIKDPTGQTLWMLQPR